MPILAAIIYAAGGIAIGVFFFGAMVACAVAVVVELFVEFEK